MCHEFDWLTWGYYIHSTIVQAAAALVALLITMVFIVRQRSEEKIRYHYESIDKSIIKSQNNMGSIVPRDVIDDYDKTEVYVVKQLSDISKKEKLGETDQMKRFYFRLMHGHYATAKKEEEYMVLFLLGAIIPIMFSVIAGILSLYCLLEAGFGMTYEVTKILSIISAGLLSIGLLSGGILGISNIFRRRKIIEY